jgi:TetR/AcrR family transcriptional regulator, repressor of fatR-cypB operon
VIEIIAKTQKIQPLDDKRARLLEAALELFETRGFDGVAVPEIAARAGVATGTVYRYFATKEALVNALYRHWKAAYNKMVLAPVPEGHSPRQTFSLYWRRMMLFARNHPRAVRFMDLHHHASYLDAESREMSQSYARTAAQFVTAARDAGAIRDLEPAMVVALMWGASAGLIKFEHQGALKFDAATSADMEEALWRAIATDT